jgi:hypothetical protein
MATSIISSIGLESSWNIAFSRWPPFLKLIDEPGCKLRIKDTGQPQDEDNALSIPLLARLHPELENFLSHPFARLFFSCMRKIVRDEIDAEDGGGGGRKTTLSALLFLPNSTP